MGVVRHEVFVAGQFSSQVNSLTLSVVRQMVAQMGRDILVPRIVLWFCLGLPSLAFYISTTLGNNLLQRRIHPPIKSSAPDCLAIINMVTRSTGKCPATKSRAMKYFATKQSAVIVNYMSACVRACGRICLMLVCASPPACLRDCLPSATLFCKTTTSELKTIFAQFIA